MHLHSLTILLPHEYQNRFDTIVYGIHPTSFGLCLLSVLGTQVCGLHFILNDPKNNRDSLLAEMQSIWHHSQVIQDQAATEPYIEKIFHSKPLSCPLIVKGTLFQSKVWESLLSVPFGTTTHYEALAACANYPKATRAVAHAVASNPISILIPCHRIIYKSGELGKYRWGSLCKKRILEWEETVSSQE